MHRPPDEFVAMERARWLGELALAIDQAQRLAWRLGVVEGDNAEAKELYAELEAVRAEVDALRFGDWVEVRKEIDPSWLQSLLGNAKLLGAADEGLDPLR